MYTVLPLAGCQPATRATETRMRGEDPSSLSGETEGEVCVAGRGTQRDQPAGDEAEEGICRSVQRRTGERETGAGRGTSRGGVSERIGARGPTESCRHRLERI